MSNDLVAVTDGAGAARETYSRGAFGDVLSAKIGTGTAQFQMADRHGDIVAAFTAGATSLAGSTAYDPFGKVTTSTGTQLQLGYQSEWTDADTGQVNMHARWYQPGTGTFTSRDTANLDPVPSVQANHYTYAGASPLNYVDPTGHQQVEVCLSGFSCGGYVCSGDTCYETDAHARWWEEYMQSPWFKESQPRFTDERAKELGVMPDGHQAPKDFWSVDEKRREAYMLAYDGRLTNQQLDLMWQLVKAMPMNEKDMEGMLPSGGVSDWLKKLQKKVGEGAWKGIKAAFCAVVGGEGQCGKLLNGDKAIWDKYGNMLAKAADIVFRSWVSLTSVMLEYNAKFKLADVERQLKAWTYKLTGAPCGSALGGRLSVCGGLPEWLFPAGRSGYTIGAVFLTKISTAAALKKTDLLQHEYVHTQQWYTYADRTGWWFSFAVAYWLAGPNPCTNGFEIQAGLVKGGYGSQCGLT
ncbi:RHS repeat-associated core domain-containing protein [Microbispora bryophytorum]|uniref:RHS repeat-associated core domain-containing protein n=1 Tax=Microbispora bryophytorum TaxID=1460882 RepID=UPI00371999F1